MWRRRPAPYDTILAENDNVYASYTHIGGRWMGGLFAKRPLSRGQVLSRYTGREYYPASAADTVNDQSYMFSARMAQDGRKRVVIDGNPAFTPSNLAGYANYAEGAAANAYFIDRSKEAPPGANTFVVLEAAESIPQGAEIRVDYDVGSSAHPFRDQMLSLGVPQRALQGRGYLQRKWVYPNMPSVHAVPLDVDAGVPTVRLMQPVVAFASRSPTRSPTRSPSRSPSRSPTRSPSPLAYSTPLKRPRGRPRKGMVWDVARGYISGPPAK